MRRTTLLVLTIVAAAAAGLLMTAQAQALDFEVGYRASWDEALEGAAPFRITGDHGGLYALARLNLPIGPEIFGARAWFLPEIGLELGEGADSHLRGQLLIDTEHGTLVLDFRAPWAEEGFRAIELRIAFRFGVTLPGAGQ